MKTLCFRCVMASMNPVIFYAQSIQFLCFHYQPSTKRNDSLIIAIATFDIKGNHREDMLEGDVGLEDAE